MTTAAHTPGPWTYTYSPYQSQDALGTFPPTLAKRPAFTLWLTLVYPHRFAPGVAKFIEDAVMQS